jgi:hypothetical protein
MPMQINIIAIELPPCDKNGRVIPITGARPIHIPIFMII